MESPVERRELEEETSWHFQNVGIGCKTGI